MTVKNEAIFINLYLQSFAKGAEAITSFALDAEMLWGVPAQKTFQAFEQLLAEHFNVKDLTTGQEEK